MKKVLCAVALAAIAAPVASTQAATVYEKDGLKYDIGGSVQIQLQQDEGIDQELDLVFDTVSIENGIEYDLGNGLTAFGQIDFALDEAANDSGRDTPTVEDAYLGMAAGDWSVTFGKTGSAADEFGVTGSMNSPLADHAFDAVGATDGDDLIKVEGSIADMITLVAAYEVVADGSDSDDGSEFFDVYASLEVAGFNLAAAYQHYEADMEAEEEESPAPQAPVMEGGPDAGPEGGPGAEMAAPVDVPAPSPEREEIDIYGVSLSYDAEVVQAGVDYSKAEYDQEDVGSAKWNVYVSVPINTVTLGAGYELVTYDDNIDQDDENGWYAHVVYAFPNQENVTIFAEIEGTDMEDHDLGYLAGMSISF